MKSPGLSEASGLRLTTVALFFAAFLPSLCAQPVITSQPQSQTVPQGYDVTFRVKTDGVPPFTYQWQFTNTPLAGATNATLRLPNVQFAHAGNYSVIVSNAGGATSSSNAALIVTPPSAVLSTVSTPDLRDFVYDSVRDVIYYTTATNIQRFHVGSNLWLAPFSCGLNLRGIDLSLDGNFLMAADGARVTNKCGVWVVDLATEVIQPIKYDPAFDETGTEWLAFGNDGAALVTAAVSGSGGAALRRIHPNGTVTDLRSVEEEAFVAASPDGGTIGITEHWSTSSQIFRYSVASQTFASGSTGAGWTGGYRPALSPGGAQLAAPTTYGGTYIFDPGFNVITNLAGQNGGLIYHPSNSLAFLAWTGSREIRALDTVNFTEAWRYDFGTNVPSGTILRTSRDGSLLLAFMEGAVRWLHWTNAAPVITNQPLAQVVYVGSNVSFTVGAMGPPPLRFQWRFQGEDLEDATNATLLVANVQFTNSGNYSAVVLGPGSFAASQPAALTVNGPPQITTDPQGATQPAGTNFSFKVSAIGPAPFSYGWRLFGTNFGAPNTNLLNLTNLQAANAGDYTVLVGNLYGAVTSQVATLVVTPSVPVILQPPQNITALAGTNVSFTVSAAGTEPLSYQWRFNDGEMVGRTNQILPLTNLQSSQAGDYAVVVSNAVGMITSAVAVLTVTPAVPRFVLSPQNVTATVGAEVSFDASAAGTEPIGYYWQFNGNDLAAAAGSALGFTAQATNAGNYTVVATNAVGATTSAVAVLTLSPPPGFLWARKGGGSNSDVGKCVAADAAGNVYVAGDFMYATKIGDSNFVSSGGLDIYVAKYDSAGQLLWARKAGGIADDSPNAIAVDANGNVYLAGYFFSGVAAFDGVTAMNYVPGGSSDLFIAKYDSDGNIQWAHGSGGSGNDVANSLACDAAGNLLVAGSFSTTLYFGTNFLTSAGNTDVLIAKLDPNGLPLWVKRAGGSSSEAALAITADAAGNVLVGGTFVLAIDFGNGVTLSSITQNEGELFLAKFDGNGAAQWARKATGAAPQVPAALATDLDGNVFVTGYFQGTTVFDTVSLTASAVDFFLAKYSAAGTIQWVRAAADYGYGLAVDAGGIAYVTGQFASTTSFGTNTLTTSGSSDVFVAAYTGSGNVLWARKAGGSAADNARGLALDGHGNAYLVGTFNSTSAAFGHVTLVASSSDMFLAKLATVDPAAPPAFTLQPANQIAAAGANISLDSGFVGAPPVALQWQFNGVSVDGATNSTLVLSNATSAVAGNYALVLSNANGMITSAVVTVSVVVDSDFVWARRGGGAANDVALATVTDPSGAVYVAGYFTDTADFGGSNLVSAGGEDIFVARYNSNGTLLWVQQFGGTGNDRATALCREPSGGIAVAGTFSGTMMFDTNTLISAGGSDVFLARFTTTGSLSWVRQGGGASNDVAQAVAAQTVGSGIYVAGYSQANATFGSTTLSISGVTNRMFLACYTTAGNFFWAATSSGTGPSEGRAVVCDAGNFVYLGGTCAGSATFGGQTLSSTGALSGFVAKYSSGGNTASWARRFGTATNTPTFNARVNGLALDPNWNAYGTGEFQGEVAFFGGTNGAVSFNTNQPDGFLLKLDSAGTAQWVKKISGPGADSGNSVVLDQVGNVYVTGNFSNSAAIGDTLLAGAGGPDMFVALFDTTGTLVKARRAGGTADDVGQAVATDGAGRVFVAGSHAAPAAFGTNSLTTAGLRDAFLTRLDFFGAQTPPQITTQPQSQTVALGSNVVLNVGAISGLPVTFRWRLNGVNITGATSNSFRLNNTQPANLGDYSVVVQSSAGAVTSLTATVAQEITPDFWWLWRTGSTGDDQALAVAVDATNNAVYVAGLFTGTNPGLSNLVASGSTDAFLARYDTNGTLIWARHAGGTLADAAQAVAVDRSGNVLVAGYFYSFTVGFGSFTLTNKSSPVASFSDLFLVKYDPAGNVLWVRQGGGTSNPNVGNRNDAATALVVDAADNIYLTGSFHAAVDFGSLQLTNLNSTNFFVAKYDGAGNALWARTTSGTNTSQGNGICLDATTNVYVTGFLLGSLNLGNGVLTNLNNAFLNPSAFVAKYDRDGALQWARKSPGVAGYGQAIIADAAGSIYATSYKRDYGNGLLLAKYDNAGTPLWQRVAAISCCTGDYTSAAGLALDRSGNPIVAGYGNGSIEGITNSFTGGYVLKYRSDGSGFWMQRCASSALSGTGSAAIAMDGADNAFIAGRFTSTSFFGATSNLVSAGGNDTFLAKLGLRPPEFGASQANFLLIAGSNAMLQVVGASGSGTLRYQWQLNGTNIVGATNVIHALNNFTYDRAGRYTVVISNQVGTATGKVAAVGFVPVLNISAGPGAAMVDWSGVFTLQSATNVAGPYADLIPATSPFTNLFGPGEAQRYFRLRVPSPNVAGNWQAGQFNLTFAGSPGRRYAIEASTNLANWTAVNTDYFPFALLDTNTAVAPQKFYRAVLLP